MIGVVLCTFDGAAHLREQLDSIGAQSVPAALFVHDDASRDSSARIARAHPAVTETVAHRVNVGFVANFERALRDWLERDLEHVALADQDDLWRPDRLERGLEAMRALEAAHGADSPLLVHSDLEMVDASGRPLAPSFMRWRGYAVGSERSLATALGQCGVMGNTCLANRVLVELALPFPPRLHVHDWWLGLVAELYGARAYVDAPLVRYRIHANNASNAADALDGGAGPPTLRRVLARDFRLPFKEDGRLGTLDALAAGDGHRPVPEGEARRTLDAFRRYLRFEGDRLRLLGTLLGGGFLKPSAAHRLRVAGAVLATARYAGTRSTARH